jgi:2-C-methyl-D-erythritol 4-phosphate cytidylyltransferase
MHSKEYALIVAGGKGTRIKSKLPKQFLELSGKPILLHTLEAFYRYSQNITVVLVLPEDDFAFGMTSVGKTTSRNLLFFKKVVKPGFNLLKMALRKLKAPDLLLFMMGCGHW